MVQLNFDLWLPPPLSLSFLFSQSSTILQPVKGSTDCSMQNEHLFPEINDCSPLDESLRSFSFSPIFDHKSVYNALASYFHLFFHEFDVMQRVFFFFSMLFCSLLFLHFALHRNFDIIGSWFFHYDTLVLFLGGAFIYFQLSVS